MKEQISCRKARRTMQEALDRSDPVSPAEGEQLRRFLPAEVSSHLERCPHCRDFLHSLGTFAPVLRSQLDEALRDYPVPEVAAVLQGKSGKAPKVPSLPRNRVAATPAVFQRFRNRLFGPAGLPAAVYRWVAVAAIALLLASSAIGIRIYSLSATHRVIEQQIDRVIELIYREPLLPGIESALLRTRPSISDYVEDLDRSIDIWLEEPALQSYLN
jgi:hypothetical protein